MEIKNKEAFYAHCHLILSNMFGDKFIISDITDESDKIRNNAFNCKFQSLTHAIKGSIYYELGWSVKIDGFLCSHRDDKLSTCFISLFKQEAGFLQNRINKYSGFVENLYSR